VFQCDPGVSLCIGAAASSPSFRPTESGNIFSSDQCHRCSTCRRLPICRRLPRVKSGSALRFADAMNTTCGRPTPTRGAASAITFERVGSHVVRLAQRSQKSSGRRVYRDLHGPRSYKPVPPVKRNPESYPVLRRFVIGDPETDSEHPRRGLGWRVKAGGVGHADYGSRLTSRHAPQIEFVVAGRVAVHTTHDGSVVSRSTAASQSFARASRLGSLISISGISICRQCANADRYRCARCARSDKPRGRRRYRLRLRDENRLFPAPLVTISMGPKFVPSVGARFSNARLHFFVL